MAPPQYGLGPEAGQRPATNGYWPGRTWSPPTILCTSTDDVTLVNDGMPTTGVVTALNRLKKVCLVLFCQLSHSYIALFSLGTANKLGKKLYDKK